MSDSPQIGKLFAKRYEVQARIGEGAMGVVYRVRDVGVGEVVALKTLLPSLVRREQALARFRREVRLSRRITHRNVVRMHDIGQEGALSYLTMELIEGQALDKLIAANGKLPLAASLDAAEQVARGLAAAHDVGVIHRDLKPSNVIIEPPRQHGRRPRAVVTDFGIARSFADERDGARTEGAIGTPHYMAPEQIQGDAIDARADIYALGGVLFEMLTGELPFIGKTPLATAMMRLTKPPRDPRDSAQLPDELAELILACLSVDPGGRPQSAQELAQALARIGSSARVAGVADTQVPLGGLTAESTNAGIGPAATPGGSVADVGQAATAVTGPHQRQQTRSEPPPPYSPRQLQRPSPYSGAPTRAPGRVATLDPGVAATLAPDSGPGSSGSMFATRGRSLAVLPFRVRGQADSEYIGEALSDELIDVLSRTGGVRVFASGATARFRDDRDPQRIGEQLGAEVVVDGTLQMMGERVRLSARMVEVVSGVQTWSERFDGRFEDVFALQETMSLRIAESLRVELAAVAKHELPAEAVEHYARARARLRVNEYHGDDGAQHYFQKCLALAPTFKPAVAGHAIASVLAWFEPDTTRTTGSGNLARESVQEALTHAAELPESHLAAAWLASHEGNYRATAESLARCLDIAPSCAAALAYLGSLQAEAGRIDAGVKRMKLAHELDPTLVIALWDIARCHALRGEYERFDELMLQAQQQGRATHAGHLVSGMRVGSWRGRMDVVAEFAQRTQQAPGRGEAQLLALYGGALLGKVDVDQASQMLTANLGAFVNVRFATLACQLAAEFAALHGRFDVAQRWFDEATDRVLADLSWVDLCPLLAPMREHEPFKKTRQRVCDRAEAFWGRSVTFAK